MRGLIIISGVIFCAVLYFMLPTSSSEMPKPTNGQTIVKDGEEEGHGDRRRAWIELMHKSAPGTNWRQLEYETQMQKQRERAGNISLRNDCTGEVLAGGLVKGQWQERGSSNQAGSVSELEYDPAADVIWLRSAGGALWKTHRTELNWEVVNQYFNFTDGMLQFIETANGRRLLANISRVPHYSDDDGETWVSAQGIAHNSSWGNVHSSTVLDDTLNTYYTISKPDYWDNLKLYKSTDKGENFHPVKTFTNHEFDRFKLCSPEQNNDLFLVEKTGNGAGKFYQLNTETDELTLLNPEGGFSFGNSRANLAAWASDTTTIFYAYSDIENQGRQVWRSDDLGVTWTAQGQLAEGPWSVGLYVLPSNPDKLLMGAVECFTSEDAGETWEKVNDWWAYYDDIEGQLHADIMNIREFQTATGQDFLLISNHGGLTYSEEFMADQGNISLQDLNVAQYYSVRTDPLDANYVYAGSQDQGFQLSGTFLDAEDGPEPFTQVISGDYGHITFANEGQSLWTVYPGGWVTCYEQAQTGNLTYSYELDSENESVWLPPLASLSNSPENVIYMAGGNIDGGPGSYLIKLTGINFGVEAEQFDYDFKTESAGGEVSAIGLAPSDPDRIYTATTNGRFFATINGGENWEQTVNFLPGGHYLYGQKILVSPSNPDLVYLAGSGYSSPAVYRSEDGGQNFNSMSAGLPQTLVFDLAINEDESLIFAATEAGPYVYVAAENEWYDLAGECAPTQTYWSVEYIPTLRTARFGTYGRGIWDFELETEVSTDAPIVEATSWTVGPNPSNGQFVLQVKQPLSGPQAIQVFDAGGRLVHREMRELHAGNVELNLTKLTAGTYWLMVGKERRKVVIVR